MPEEKSTLETEVQTFLEPVQRAANSEYHRRELLKRMGWNPNEVPLDELPGAFDALIDSASSLAALAESPPETIDEFLDALETVGKLLNSVQTIQQSGSFVATLDPEDVAQFCQDLTSVLLVAYADRGHPLLTQVALLLTIIERPEEEGEQITDDSGNVLRESGPDMQVAFERLGDLLTDPAGFLTEGYFGTKEIDDVNDVKEGMPLLLQRIAMPLRVLGVRVNTGTAKVDHETSHISGEQVGWLQMRLNDVVSDVDFRLRAIVYWEDDGEFAVALVPSGGGTLHRVIEPWEVNVEFDGKGTELAITSDGVSFDGTADNALTITTEATKLPGEDSENALVVGGTESTRLEVGTLGASLDTTFEGGRETVDVQGHARDSTFVLSAGDGDSFLQKVLPDEGIDVDFDLGLGWANDRGVYVNGSGSLELHLPLHLSFGEAVEVPALDLAVDVADDGSIPVETVTTANVKLGPMAGTVENVGLDATVSFPEDGDGNLGPVDVDLGFSPPEGIALSIDSSGVTGGGYLFFDPEEERYAGALQLEIGKLTLSAVGLLTTELPDGSDGFSLLVIISGEFPSVQLGFGFTLEGVGGLLGVNRATRVTPLRKGVREGTAASLLFPESPVENAQRIVSDLRSIFPPKRGQHVFGPMVKVGWGTPKLIDASLAVLLELPSPTRLLLLGKLSAVLPDDDAALLQLRMNALGVVNFSESRASLDASLYDSRVATFALKGDMAMRTNWGESPGFGLSVGGFNPRFDPPNDYPELKRVSVNLAAGNNPRLRLAGYFAVTSNTVQVGASVDLHAAAGPFSIDGHLGFDALFQFDPFKFVIDIAASVAFKFNGSTLLSVSVSGTLAGPGPFHVKGTASISLLFISASVSFDATFGSSSDGEKLPPAEVLPKVADAVGDRRNWTAQMPETDHSFVSLRDVEPGDGELLAHPLGTLGFRERVVPLGVRIEKFGSATPADYSTFEVASVRVDGEEQSVSGADGGGELREEFAPAQFFELSDSEKLSRPSFEKFPAGHRVGNDLFGFGGETDEAERRSRSLAYESSYVDEANDAFHESMGRMQVSAETTDALSAVSAVAKGDARTTGVAGYAGPDQSVSFGDTQYVVVGADDLARRTDGALPDEPTTYTEAEQALDAYRRDNPDAGDLKVVAVHETRAAQVEGPA